MKKRIIIAFGLVALLWPIINANAYMIVEVNLPSIVFHAELAFKGVCQEKEERIIFPKTAPNGIVVTHYKFQVNDVLKGEVPGVFEFDQYGVATKEQAAKLGAPFAVGFIQFEPGKEYVVFLSGTTRLGVRAPVGIEQGVFFVIYTDAGKATVINRFANKNLFINLPLDKGMTKALKSINVDPKNPPVGPLDYDDFKSMVEVFK